MDRRRRSFSVPKTKEDMNARAAFVERARKNTRRFVARTTIRNDDMDSTHSSNDATPTYTAQQRGKIIKELRRYAQKINHKYELKYGGEHSASSHSISQPNNRNRPLQIDVCYDYQNRGECRRGQLCPFQHVSAAKSLCLEWKRGACLRGDFCRFAHCYDDDIVEPIERHTSCSNVMHRHRNHNTHSHSARQKIAYIPQPLIAAPMIIKSDSCTGNAMRNVLRARPVAIIVNDQETTQSRNETFSYLTPTRHSEVSAAAQGWNFTSRSLPPSPLQPPPPNSALPTLHESCEYAHPAHPEPLKQEPQRSNDNDEDFQSDFDFDFEHLHQ